MSILFLNSTLSAPHFAIETVGKRSATIVRDASAYFYNGR